MCTLLNPSNVDAVRELKERLGAARKIQLSNQLGEGGNRWERQLVQEPLEAVVGAGVFACMGRSAVSASKRVFGAHVCLRASGHVVPAETV